MNVEHPDRALLWTIDIAKDDGGIAEHRDWHHLQCDLPTAHREMKKLSVKLAVAEALTTIETRPRATPLEGGTLLILRGINSNPGSDPEDMIAVRIWFDSTTVLTSRRRTRPLSSIEDLRLEYENMRGPSDTGDFVLALIRRLVNRIGEFVDQIDEEMTALESFDDITGSRSHSTRIAELRRETAAVRRYLAPQRDALDALSRMRDVFSDTGIAALREEIDRSTRYIEDLELARERAIVLQEEVRSEIAKQQNVRMYALSLVTAIFLPLSFLTGLFGMNVAGLPGTEDPSAFAWVAGSMTAIAVVCALIFRWIRWF